MQGEGGETVEFLNLVIDKLKRHVWHYGPVGGVSDPSDTAFLEGNSIVNRADWQEIAEGKLFAAEALLAASQWSAAYYMAGYAIECGLKSCILVRLAGSPEVIFENKKSKKYSENCWTHNVEELVELAGLKPDRDTAVVATPALATNWAIVSKWNEETRYQVKTEPEARELYNAITDPVNGVMQWIKARW